MKQTGEGKDSKAAQPKPAATGSEEARAVGSPEMAEKKKVFVKRLKELLADVYPSLTLVDLNFVQVKARDIRVEMGVQRAETPPETTSAEAGTSRLASFNMAASLFGLLLSATAVTMLLLILFKPNPSDPQPSLDRFEKAVLDETRKLADAAKTDREQVDKIAGSIATLDIAINDKTSKPAPPAPPDPTVVKALQEAQKTLKGLETKVELKLAPVALPADYWQNLAKALLAETGLPRDYWEKLKNQLAASGLPNDYWDQLAKALAANKPERSSETKPRDTYLVITHGRAMDANQYIRSLKEALLRTGARGPDATNRVGLAIASTDKLTEFVKPMDKAVDLQGFGPSNPDASEAPRLFGGKLATFFPADRTDRRSVLLVSDRANAPAVDQPEEMDGWADLTRVDVLILAEKDSKDFQKDDWSRFANWCEFVEHCHGGVQIIGHHIDKQRQNDLLRDTLRRLLSQAE